MILKLLIVLSLIMTGAMSYAKEFTVDPSHSNVKFKIKHLFSQFEGGFKEFESDFVFDEAKPEKSTGEFVIKAASINTENADRDKHLRSGEFFDVEKFPTLKFVGKKFKKVGKDKYILEGELTIRDKTKSDMKFDVEYLGSGTDPWGKNRAGFTAKGKINRKYFGVNWNKALDKGGFVLGEEVEILMNIEATEKVAKK